MHDVHRCVDEMYCDEASRDTDRKINNAQVNRCRNRANRPGAVELSTHNAKRFPTFRVAGLTCSLDETRHPTTGSSCRSTTASG